MWENSDDLNCNTCKYVRVSKWVLCLSLTYHLLPSVWQLEVEGIVIKVSWFFVHVGLANVGLVVWQPCQLICLCCCYWKCFSFCALALMQNLDTFNCKGIVIAVLCLCLEIAVFLCCLSSDIPRMHLDTWTKNENHHSFQKMDCQKCYRCVSRMALMLRAYTSLSKPWQHLEVILMVL